MAEVKCPVCGVTIHVPEKKGGMSWGMGCLIAAVSIPVFVAVLGILAAIAFPAFAKAREAATRSVCIQNLRTLEVAKERVALEHNYRRGDAVSEQEVAPFLEKDFAGLKCPKGGHYTINPVGREPECSVHGTLSNARDRRTR